MAWSRDTILQIGPHCSADTVLAGGVNWLKKYSAEKTKGFRQFPFSWTWKGNRSFQVLTFFTFQQHRIVKTFGKNVYVKYVAVMQCVKAALNLAAPSHAPSIP